MKKRRVVLGVTGSIAAYKAAELVRRLIQADCDVRVVMTEGSQQFVSELTFRTLSRNPVGTAMFPETEAWRPDHISFAEFGEVMLIAPCTANVLAKVALGIADDLLSCTVLASKAPLVIAPAMNEVMWQAAVTQKNVSSLQQRGVKLVMPGSGDLACGYQGNGRLAELEQILQTVNEALG